MNQHSAALVGEVVACLPHYERWRNRWIQLCGKTTWDPPDFGAGRVWLRRGYLHPDWTATGVDTSTGLCAVLFATTERRSEPLITVRALFSSPSDAVKFIVVKMADELRVEVRRAPIRSAWKAAGLDPRIGAAPVSAREAQALRDVPDVSVTRGRPTSPPTP